MRHRWFLALLILLIAALLPGCIGQLLAGQRYIVVQIERDGVLVLKTEYGVSDNLSPAAIWRSLQSDSFDAIGTIEPQSDDALKAVLKGKIRIVILHVKNSVAAANVDELKLIRASDSSTQWQLAPGEVERTGKLRGFRCFVPTLAPAPSNFADRSANRWHWRCQCFDASAVAIEPDP